MVWGIMGMPTSNRKNRKPETDPGLIIEHGNRISQQRVENLSWVE